MSASDILNEQNLAYEESLRADQMKDRLRSMETAKFKKGEEVVYVPAGAAATRAVVVDVHYDDIPAYYTIRVDGNERSTLEQFLAPTPFDSDADLESDEEEEPVRPSAEQLRALRLRALQPKRRRQRRDGIDPQNVLVRRLRVRG